MSEKNTYYPYSHGHLPSTMRLGSLYMNMTNPTKGLETERFEFRKRFEFQNGPKLSEDSLSDQGYLKFIKPWITVDRSDDKSVSSLDDAFSKDSSASEDDDEENVGSGDSDSEDENGNATDETSHEITNKSGQEIDHLSDSTSADTAVGDSEDMVIEGVVEKGKKRKLRKSSNDQDLRKKETASQVIKGEKKTLKNGKQEAAKVQGKGKKLTTGTKSKAHTTSKTKKKGERRKTAIQSHLNKQSYVLDFKVTNKWFGSLDFKPASISGDKTQEYEVFIRGKYGLRTEIQWPRAFLKECVLKQPNIQDWIRDKASISFKAWVSGKWHSADIWMLTGIQYISDAHVEVRWNPEKKVQAKMEADVGAAMGGPSGLATIGGAGGHSSSSRILNEYGHKGKRIWGAQFMKLSVIFSKPPPASLESSHDQKKKLMTVDLFDIENIELGFKREVGNENAVVSGMSNDLIDHSKKWDGQIAEIDLEDDIWVGESESTKRQTSESKDVSIRPVFSESPYEEEMAKVDWEEYEKYSLYLRYRQDDW